MSAIVLADPPSPYDLDFLNSKDLPELVRLVGLPELVRIHFLKDENQSTLHLEENCPHCPEVKIQRAYYAHCQIWKQLPAPPVKPPALLWDTGRAIALELLYKASKSRATYSEWVRQECAKGPAGAIEQYDKANPEPTPPPPPPIIGKWFDRLFCIPPTDVWQFKNPALIGRVIRALSWRDGRRNGVRFDYASLPDGVNDVTPLPPAIPPLAALEYRRTDRVSVKYDLPDLTPPETAEERRGRLKGQMAEAKAREDYAEAARIKAELAKGNPE